MPTGIWLYSYLALWALLLFEAALLVALIRQVGTLHAHWVSNEPDWGLPLGAPAPSLDVASLAGRPVSLAVERHRKTVLYFLSPGCPSCRSIVPWLDVISQIRSVELVVILTGSRMRIEVFAAEIAHKTSGFEIPIVADEDHVLMDRYNVSAVPYCIVIDEDGRIGSQGSAVTRTEVESLVLQADGRRRSPLAAIELATETESITFDESPMQHPEPVQS